MATAVLLIAAGLVEAPPGSTGAPHPEFETLRVGGDGAARLAPVFPIAVAFAFVQVALFAACFALGLGAGPGLGRWIGVVAAGHAAIWVVFLTSAWRFAESGAAPIVLGFPLPTAIMVFALWPLPVGFGLLYLVAFDRHVLPTGSLDRFRARLAALRRGGP